MNIPIGKVADEASDVLGKMLRQRAPEIGETWEEIEEEAAGHNKNPCLKMGFSISVDPVEGEVTYELNYSLRRKTTVRRPLPDPDQAELPITTDDPPGVKRKRARAK